MTGIVPILAERTSATHLVRSLDATVDLSLLHEAYPSRYPHLLESVAHGTPQARFDVLFAHPGDALVLDPGKAGEIRGSTRCARFLPELDRWWRAERVGFDAGARIPFRGGWFVYLGYELASEIEPTLALPTDGRIFPRAFAQRFPAGVVRDHDRGCLHVLAEPERRDLLDGICADLESLIASQAAPETAATVVAALREDPPERYLDGVGRIKGYIHDGDVFQVNLSRGWEARAAGARSVTLYRALRAANPGPFAGLATWGEAAVISSSPERLVNVHGPEIQTRPIAGTRPRGGGEQDDLAFRQELIGHPKERAEHVMLIDLERNDIGRVCAAGTVEVNELMVLESYAHVHHIVSNVRGRLAPGTTPGAVVAAVFPGGTITGCPKVRCMEIIAELEQTPRDAYTGSMGYLNRDGDMDLNILIRTLLQHNDELTVRAGAGIVADSVPEWELEETRAKARGLLLALGGTV